jgi:hypothetical protein
MSLPYCAPTLKRTLQSIRIGPIRKEEPMPTKSTEIFALIGCVTVMYVSFRLAIKVLIRATDWAIRKVENWKD